MRSSREPSPDAIAPRGTASGLAVATEGIQLAFGNIAGAALGLLYQVVVARLLGAARFSDLALCLSLSYVGLLFLGPLNLTLIRFSSTYGDAENASQIRPLLRRMWRVYAPWVAAGMLVGVVFAEPIAERLNVSSAALIPWTGVFISLGLALGAARAVAIGMHEHRVYGESLLTDTVVRLAAGLALVFAYRSAGAALAGFLLGAAAALALLAVRTHARVPPSAEPWHDAPNVSRFMTLSLVLAAVLAGLQNLDMVVVKARLSDVDAGQYALALATARSLLLIAAPFGAIALARDESHTRGAPLYSYVALGLPLVGVLALVPGPALQLLYGGAAAGAAQLLPPLALAFGVAGAFLILAHAEIRAGRTAFMIPVCAVLAVEQVVLLLARPLPLTFAWIVFGAHAAAAGSVLITRAAARR